MENTIALADKRRRIIVPPSKTPLIKCGKAQSCTEDRISNLPDEVLVSIVSRLKFEQAASTSVLSRRWRDLWRFSRNLKLKFRDGLWLDFEDESFGLRCREFIDWVNYILKSHRGETIDGLSFEFCLDDKSFKSDIDSWISFAFQKRVKKLKLNFACNWTNGGLGYPLTADILHGYRLDSLTSLYLWHVDVTEEVLYYFLSVCPSLEELSTIHNMCLVNFSVSGPSLKLRHLEIQDAWYLEKLDICDSNLVSFKYTGEKTSISLKDTPLLVKASFGLGYACTIVQNSIHGSSYLQQLETLVLDFRCQYKKLRRFPNFPKLRNLRQLELVLTPSVSRLVLCGCLLRASPLLTRLKIEFRDFKDSTREETEVRRPKQPHKCLKIIGLITMVGCKAQLQIASYLLGSAPSLGKIIIDPRVQNKRIREDSDKLQTARNRVRQHLETRLPVGTELVVL
ncbi:hypothetical protein RHMOL_Rhmol01G0369700 [Rhododendron molle]|uniref:Uncharacterized protein n=6 Tax=Rhododendron molle TaxID=49168 RepID=A0ACC0QBN9_RHOML|nr:hypothetical protein RHMOL_Rhmol01G0367600 [Rhododendron molle]KAI8574634.1 hypothetical protein RHMOL_Rhmol01G0369700 [Rhododendron molle]KAI8574635.1 hypothetical protein RHMOL_Rhmol01G0369700 [Rhododendron molle]KAI8574636.1 hypothetical protein RHMOL_Rhmol01G0369700 [Rhododendron molle]KAI8574637.1 hypothetical protein RHMOL_Rhmol01G0369700 [Rhododendron molle]